jgi:hypothetical protein
MARIFVLKVTHLPIVAAVWFFEIAHEQIRESNTFSSIQPTHHVLGPSPVPKVQPAHSNHGPSSSSQHQPTAPKGDDVPSPSKEVDTGKVKKGVDSTVVLSNIILEDQVKELSGQVKNLSAKIAELTALIMAQQGTATPPEEEDGDEGA